MPSIHIHVSDRMRATGATGMIFLARTPRRAAAKKNLDRGSGRVRSGAGAPMRARLRARRARTD